MKRPFETFTCSHRSSTRAARPKRRLCRLESLERRDLLSAVPLSASEYAALTAQYSSLSLPETMDDLNVITLGLSEGDDINSLKSAIVKAAHTYESDLIVVRTTADANTLTYTSEADELNINIDSNVFGSLTIVGLGDEPLTLDATSFGRGFSLLNSSDANSKLNILNLSFKTARHGGATLVGESINLVSSNFTGADLSVSAVTSTIDGCRFDLGNISIDSGISLVNQCIFNSSELYVSLDIWEFIGTNSEELIEEFKGVVNQCTFNGSFTAIRFDTSFIPFTITNSTISGSDCGIQGHGLATIDNCKITDCIRGVDLEGNINISNTSISQNSGLGLAINGGKITNCQISENQGGGISVASGSSVIISNTVIRKNQQSKGGRTGGVGVYSDAEVSIINTLIADNSAEYYGAGIFNDSGTVKITNSTITGNTTKVEGSGGIRNNTSSGKVELYNTIVVGNTGDISGWVSGSNNLTTSAQWQSGENNLTYDAALPLFKDEENGDYSLADNSQAADRGSDELAELAGLDELAKDLAGNARFQNDSIDIGAFESGDVKIQLPPTVTLNKIPALTAKSSITLTWKPEDADSDLVFCEVWVAKDSAEFVKVAENVTNGEYVFAFDGDGQYSFKVTAVDEAGNLAESEVQECVFDSTAPVVILGEVPAQTNAESVTLTWTAEDAKFCEVWVSKDGAEFVRAAENVTDGEYTHMFNGEGQYTFRIVAIDEAGNESGPAEGQVTFKTAAPPNVTFGYMPEIVNSQSEYLMWFADDPDNDLAYCELYVSKDGAEFERLGGDWTDMGCMVNFDSSGTYRFQIIAVDAAGNRSDADEIEIRAELSTNISSVTFGDIPTSIDQRSVHLYWSCNIKAVSYILTVFQGETKLETIETSKNSKIWTAEEDGDYRFCVVAVDEAGNHSEPAEITINVQTCQVHCMFLISPGTVTTEELDLIWQVEDTMEGDFAYGELYVSKDGGEPVLVSGNLTETMYSYRFESNGLYQFQIYAFDKAGNRSNADSLEVQVELNALPVRFDDIPTSTNSKNIDLHWTCKTEAVSYLLTVSLEGRELATIQMTGNSLTWTAEEDGNYLFRVSAIDAGGNYSEPAEQYVSVETCPVNVMLYSIWEEEGYIKLFWQVEDTIEEDFAYCELYVSKDGAKYQQVGGNLTGSQYSYQYETDGQYSFRIYAIDKTGNRSRVNEAGITVDHTAPTVTLGEIAQMTKDEEILLTWTVKEFASCTVWVSKDGAEFVRAAENVTDGKYVFAFDGDGRYSFKVTAVDEAGNLAESEVQECVFDSTAPVVILGEVPAQTNAESVTLTWTAEDAKFCEVWVSKDGTDFVKAAENVTGGEYAFTFEGDGRYSFKVTAVDEVGNLAESEALECVFDSTAPVVILGEVPAQTNAESVTLTWTAEDAKFCEVWVSKDGADFVKAAENVTGGEYVFAFNGDGRYSFKVTAVDEVGNLAESEERECVFDSTAPAVILGEVPAQTNAESVTLTWTAEDAKFCEVWVSKDGADFVKAAENVTGGEYVFAFDGDGRYSFKVTAVDEVGNLAESEVVSVEKWTEPEPSVSAAVSGNRVKVVWENDGPEADSVRYREAGTQRWTVRKLKAGVSEFAFNGRAGKEYEIQVLCGQQEDRILTESVTLLVSPKMKAERNSVTDESFAVNVSNWAGQLSECASMVCVTLNGERQEIALENGRGSCVFSGGETAEFADGVLRFGNVKSNFQHTVRVAFSNGESTSAETSPLRIRTAMAAYDAPVIKSVEALDGKSVCVTWTTAYGKNSTQAAKYYTVQYSTDGERWRTAATRAEGNAFILTNLKAQTQYLVSVFATRDRDFTASVPSESTLVKTAFPTPAITSARSTQTGRVVISWKSVSDAAQYELAYRETESSKWSVIPVSSSDAKVTFTLFGLNSGKDYEFRLRALPLDTTIQTSGWSGIKTVKKIK